MHHHLRAVSLGIALGARAYAVATKGCLNMSGLMKYDSAEVYSGVISLKLHRTSGSQIFSQSVTISHEDAYRLAADVNRQLMSRAQPLINPMQLPGGHTEVLQWADDADVEFTHDLFPSVRLTALLALHPDLSSPEAPAATTVAIRMDQSVALRLAERIRGLARIMGWPLLE